MKSVMSMAVALVLVLTAAMGVAVSSRADAASGGTTVYIGSRDGNQFVAGSCIELRTYSRKGCDENGDGLVRFANIPAGTYTVHFDSVPSGYDRPKDHTINVRVVPGDDFSYDVDLTTGDPVASRDISIVSLEVYSAAHLTGACYELRGYSKIGCDENGDGQVDFRGIPYGTYTVDVIRAPDSYQTYEAGGSIQITVSRTEPGPDDLYYVSYVGGNGNTGSQTSDSAHIAIGPFDNETNDSLTGACFQIVGYSKIGCDDNRDGAVMFADIPYGTWTVQVTTAPHGYYPTYGDTITITVSDGSDVSDGTAYYFAFSQY